ncbi:MAG: hypothetical protein PHU71_07060 [Candidatus Gracilibacteria bacterium]|nr:hypothetical protein [Candidatus Gracilibacteria bacterium]
MKNNRILFTFVGILVMVGIAAAFNVSDNPSGALSAFYQKYFAKAKPITFQISYAAYDDTVGSSAPSVSLDTITPCSRNYMWRAPFDCRIDSVYIQCGYDDSLKAADSVALLAISNNSATNADTFICDSLNGVQALFTPASMHGGPDSALNKVAKGKWVRFRLNPAGSAITSESVFYVSFIAIPADR